MKIRLVGASAQVARHAGISIRRVGVYAMLLSGALAGLAAAALLLAGDEPEMTDDFEGFVGFHGIAVALLARNSPIGAIPAAILFSALAQGSTLVEALVGVSSAVADITQGIVILLVLAGTTMLHSFRTSRLGVVQTPRAPEAAPTPEAV
jgi:simple sugar transport system permease protein